MFVCFCLFLVEHLLNFFSVTITSRHCLKPYVSHLVYTTDVDDDDNDDDYYGDGDDDDDRNDNNDDDKSSTTIYTQPK